MAPGAGAAGLHPGVVLADRYEIVQMLGEGGMGAVYKAKDRELDRLVAVKVIRPELAERPDILQRFKRELILARQVTHRNVIRIYDLGQAAGLKFITMEYVEGQDLRHILHEKGKLPPEEAVGIIEQVCCALEAAHAVGVVHRDLKPPNVMLDREGRVLVMDFGIARSMEQAGLTQTGMMVGTPEYMSPEQAKGETVDTRSDLFAAGIIFYEMLIGKQPYQSDTAIGTLMKRLQGRTPVPSEAEPTLPQALSDITVKCLAVDPAERYQTAREILRDLEAWRGPTPGAEGAVPAPRLAAAVRHWKWAAAGLAALLLLVAGLSLVRERMARRAAVPLKTVKLLVADFHNATGDPIFEGTLEPMFVIAMEGAPFITSFNRVQARRLAAQVQPGATKLDEAVARLVALREGIDVVVAGSIGRQGKSYGVAVKAIDGATGKLLAAREAKIAGKEAVLGAVGKLAAPLRKALGDTTPEAAQLAAAETFTAATVEAAHTYAQGQELLLAGKVEEAVRQYGRAVELDPKLGRAYSGLAVLYANMGQPQEAEKYFQLALQRMERMSERERYRTRGTYYVTVRNYDKAIEEFSALVKQYPADSAGHANLAIAYLNSRNIPKALEEGRRAIEIYPKNVSQRNNLALFALYGSDFETARAEAQRVLELNPTFAKGFVVLALGELAQGRPAQAAEWYQKLEKVGARGASYASMGLADLALYEGRRADAAASLEQGIAGDLAAKNAAAAAEKTAVLAGTLLGRGQKAAAIAAADRALGAAKKDLVMLLAAEVYLEAGQEPKALALAKDFGARLEPELQSYARLIEGQVQHRRNNLQEAIRLFREGRKLLDTWLARFRLGQAYLDAGAFTEAYSEFEQCLKRRGEATALLFDEVATYRFLPPVYYYMGRAQDGLKTEGGADSYKTFLGIKQKADGDPLVEDARRRLAGR
jgi:tetratricopeptide (TPR) repeat protein/predicted Ser/Thr protein kinase